MGWEQQRGLKGLALLVVPSGGEGLSADSIAILDRLGVDHMALELPQLEDLEPWTDVPTRPEPRRQLAELLASLCYRTGARQLYLPLGAGGDARSRLCLDAGLEVQEAGASRNVFLYEERPELFVPGAVRIRLGEIAARLPPGAADLRDGGGLLRFFLQVMLARHLPVDGFAARLACARRALRARRAAQAWQPTRALGVRLQPVLQPGVAAEVAQLLDRIPASVERAYGSAERATRRTARHARRHGERAGWLERYWLVLPPRVEGGVRTLTPGFGSESPAA